MSPSLSPECQAGDSVLTKTISIPGLSFRDLMLHPRYGNLLYSNKSSLLSPHSLGSLIRILNLSFTFSIPIFIFNHFQDLSNLNFNYFYLQLKLILFFYSAK